MHVSLFVLQPCHIMLPLVLQRKQPTGILVSRSGIKVYVADVMFCHKWNCQALCQFFSMHVTG